MQLSLWMRVSTVLLLGCVAFLPPEGQRKTRVVDCPDVPGDGVLPPQPEANAANLRAGFLTIGTSRPKLVIYEDRKGVAVFQGDIVLGTTAAMQQNPGGGQGQIEPQGIVLGGPIQWPGATVPYEIDPSLPNKTRVTSAITEWTTKTSLQFTPHAGEQDFVSFTVGSGCSSQLGHQGGKQVIQLADTCAVPQAIHEIGHTIGLLHEHTRSDRDQYIQINWQNIPAIWQSQFQNANPSQDVGVYDFCSIMHYPATADSYNNGHLPVFQETNSCPACMPGRATALSPGDVATVSLLYPNPSARPKRNKPGQRH